MTFGSYKTRNTFTKLFQTLQKYGNVVGAGIIVQKLKNSARSFERYSLLSKGPVTRYNFSCNVQRNSTLKRCKFVTNVWYVKNILANCDGNLYLPSLHLPRVDRIALQIARKIASYDRALNLVFGM